VLFPAGSSAARAGAARPNAWRKAGCLADVTVAVPATDLQDGSATCEALATSNATVTEPTNNSRATRQNGLVNLNVEDLFLQVPVAVAAKICDVDVVVLRARSC